MLLYKPIQAYVNQPAQLKEIMPDQPIQELWTLEDVADYLRVSTATIRRWTNSGKLHCYRLGGNRERRFSKEKVLQFLAQSEQQVQA